MGPIVQLIIAELPDVINRIKEAHAMKNPNAPPLTSQQIVDAFEQLFTNDIAKDEALKFALQAEINRQ